MFTSYLLNISSENPNSAIVFWNSKSNPLYLIQGLGLRIDMSFMPILLHTKQLFPSMDPTKDNNLTCVSREELMDLGYHFCTNRVTIQRICSREFNKKQLVLLF